MIEGIPSGHSWDNVFTKQLSVEQEVKTHFGDVCFGEENTDWILAGRDCFICWTSGCMFLFGIDLSGTPKRPVIPVQWDEHTEACTNVPTEGLTYNLNTWCLWPHLLPVRKHKEEDRLNEEKSVSWSVPVVWKINSSTLRGPFSPFFHS